MMTAPSAATARRRFPVWLAVVLLALVTVSLYWPATGCDFVDYDDNQYVRENIHVTSGLTWENVRWAFCRSYAANWHPITWLSHMLDCQLFGLNPWEHHLSSVLLHALNAVLVFVLLQQLTGAVWRSLAVAILFAVHPLRVESVAWVAERKDVLSGAFGLLALIFYARYARQAKRVSVSRCLRTSSYWLSLLFLALGLMSKPMLVTWPFVLLLLDYWPLRRFGDFTQQGSKVAVSRLVAEKIPFLVLAVVASVLTFMVQQQAGAVVAAGNLPMGARAGNAMVSYCSYLGKVFWPTDLVVFYPHPGRWPLGLVLGAGGVIVVLSVLVWVRRQQFPFLLMGWLWFIGMLVPVIGLVQVGEQAMADRYTYGPAIGLAIGLVWGLHRLGSGGRFRQTALSAAACVAIVTSMVLTRQQLGHWQDSEKLFRHALGATKDNYLAHYTLGTTLGEKGQSDEAIHHFEQAIRLKSSYAEAYSNLGVTLAKIGQTDAAIRQYREAIRLRPRYAEAHCKLGIALAKIGQVDEAIHHLKEALSLKPDHVEAYYGLGVTLEARGEVDQAVRQYQEVVRLKPAYAEARNNLGVALAKIDRTDEAIRHFEEALRLKPDFVEACNNLGITCGKKGQQDRAVRHYQEALRLRPDYAEAHNNLGAAYFEQDRTADAIREYQEALRLKPDYAEACNNLGMAFAKNGQFDEAIRQFQEAVKLKPDDADARRNLETALAARADSSQLPDSAIKP